MNNLTRQEKFMNMAKLGIVSTVGNFFHSFNKLSKYGACRMTAYTLCEVMYVIQIPTYPVEQPRIIRSILFLFKK